MCGLFGFCGDPKIIDNNVAKVIQAKTKILGLYNIERGKHSCGVFMDNQILKGVDNDKVFSDFIQNNQLPDSMRSGVHTVIGHTRQATQGIHNYDNAHPFLVDRKFILAHNGVIRNIWTLCNKYGIDHTGIHVDSLGLAHIIYKHGFKVLNEYEGFAALLMAKADEPNSLYVYRGVSKRTSTGAEEEERPMFYMQSEEGVYVSSLEKSLLAISDSSSDKIKQLEGSIVHKFTNGRMTKAKFAVDRGNMNVGVSTVSHAGTHHYPNTGAVAVRPTTTTTPTSTTPGNATNSRVGASHSSQDFTTGRTLLEKAIVPMIWHETLPNRIDRYKVGEGIFFHMGRYWVLKVDEITLAHGAFYINKKGKIYDHKAKDAHNHYFYEGVKMKNEKAWKEALADTNLTSVLYNFAMHISKYSEYPVCNTRADSLSRNKNVSDYCKYRWYQNCTMLTNTGFTPQFSDRNYTIRDGLISNIAMQPGVGKHVPKEECVDTISLKAERTRSESGIPNHTAPVIQMPNTTLKQSDIPFLNKEEEALPAVKIPEWDVTNFYRVWTSIEQARSTMIVSELNAVRYYVADVMMGEMGIVPDNIHEDVVDVQLNMFLNMCIESQMSINEMWDDKNYQDILHYLAISDANPDGQFKGEDECKDACEFVPKPIVAANNSVPPINLNNVNDVFPADGDKPMIDEVIEKEQAGVPVVDAETDELYVEETDANTDKEYAFKDIVDYLGTVRDAANDLTGLEDDDFAQNVAATVYGAVDPLLYKLQELCITHGESELATYLAQQIKAKVGI
jgi:hypothetical protein